MGVTQFEREMMLERQREGIAKAKAAGKYRSRKLVFIDKRDSVPQLAASGMTKAQIARELQIGQATVYRTLAGATPKSSPTAWRALIPDDATAAIRRISPALSDRHGDTESYL